MLTSAIQPSRHWTAATLDVPSAWHVALPSACLTALGGHLDELQGEPRPVTELCLSPEERDTCARALQRALEALEQGRGFVILDGLPEHYSRDEMQAAYWLLGQALGDPITQNVQGTLLYDVRDTGQDVRYGARFSVTNAESTFHTDNSFGNEILDYVGLLCLRGAKSGGLSQLVNGRAVEEELRQRDPDAYTTLQQLFHVDRRGGVKPGESPTARYAVVTAAGDALLWRYLRYWIEAGHEKANEPLTSAQRRSLDVLDGVLGEPGLRAEFLLRPGEMLWTNNRWLLHNRTAFEDHPEPERQRHYVRLWLRRHVRPLSAERLPASRPRAV